MSANGVTLYNKAGHSACYQRVLIALHHLSGKCLSSYCPGRKPVKGEENPFCPAPEEAGPPPLAACCPPRPAAPRCGSGQTCTAWGDASLLPLLMLQEPWLPMRGGPQGIFHILFLKLILDPEEENLDQIQFDR